MTARTAVLMVLLLGAAAPAFATPEDCASVDDDAARLLCYDSFFRSAPLPAAALAPAVGPPESDAAAPASLVATRLIDEAALADQLFSITPHRPNYILPVTYNTSPEYAPYLAFEEDFSHTEVKMQLSLKTRLAHGLWGDSSLWAAYTQQSYWQLYADSDASAPFRETNHEPEVFWQLPLDLELFGWRARLASVGLNHQSNGRSEPLSRSWNRVTGELVIDRGQWVAAVRTWLRIEENAEDDDNPKIEDYMGRLQLSLIHRRERNTFALRFRNNLSSNRNRSGVEVNWTFPLTRRLKGFVQLYSGYGENLVDMENYNNRIGVGITLTDFL